MTGGTAMLLASLMDARLWWALPLLIATSLVYSATRHERTREILFGAIRAFVMGVVFMTLIFLLFWLVR